MKKTCELRTEKPQLASRFEPRTCLLGSDTANHCTAPLCAYITVILFCRYYLFGDKNSLFTLQFIHKGISNHV